MINSQEFIHRLKIIIEYYEISASILADKMEIPRSSISHILSGRNKPSLDFVLKILKSFPEVDLYWLLNGVGEFPKKKQNEFNISSTPTENLSKDNNFNLNDREIDRIVIFFKDGTFKNYTS